MHGGADDDAVVGGRDHRLTPTVARPTSRLRWYTMVHWAGSRTFVSLQHRQFRLLWTATLGSNVGTWAQRVAQDWLVLDLTGSPAALGIVTGLQFLPSLLLGLPSGALADRVDRRRFLMAVNTAAAMSAALLGVLTVTGYVTMAWVYVLAFSLGAISALDVPTRTAMVNDLVPREHVPNAVGLTSASFNFGRLAGPALSGTLIALFGTGVSFLLNAASYMPVLLALWLMRKGIPETAPRTHARILGDMRDGLRYVTSRRRLAGFMGLVFLASGLGLNMQLFIAAMARTVFNRDAASFGFLGSLLAVGSLVGGLLWARRKSDPSLTRTAIMVVAFSLLQVVAAASPNVVVFAVFLPLIGLTSMIFITSANSFVQLTVASEFRGRVLGIYHLVFLGGTPIFAPILGFLGETFGARVMMAAGGAAAAIVAMTAWFVLSRVDGRPGRSVR